MRKHNQIDTLGRIIRRTFDF